MGAETKIEWADFTFNPWIGCTKVSPGCLNCYADTQDKHRKWTPEGWGKGKPRRRTSAANWKLPLKWNRGAKQERPRVFCASLADWLDYEIPISWLVDLLKLIHDTPGLDWLLLTKRPENWAMRIRNALRYHRNENMMSGGSWHSSTDGVFYESMWKWLTHKSSPPNVWLGTSVEDQQRADERIPQLLDIPARVRFLSMEPLLEEVSLIKMKHNNDWEPSIPDGIDWVIVGGESGPKARPCNIEWIRSIVKQCRDADVPCFVKQFGAAPVLKSGVKFPLRDKKGGDIEEFFADLRVRQFPEVDDEIQEVAR